MFHLIIVASLLHTPRLWGRLFGPAPATVEPLNVTLEALDRVWIEVRVDGDVRHSGWMESEQKLEMEAQQEVYVWCGRADRLSVSINEAPAGTLATLTDTPSRSPSWYTFRNSEPLGV